MTHYFLDQLPAGYQAAFGISEIRNPELLAQVRQTAFTWAEQPGTLCLAVNRKYFDAAAANDNIAAIICPRNAIKAGTSVHKAIVLAERADELFYVVHNLAVHESQRTGSMHPVENEIHPRAHIASSVRMVGAGISIGANTRIDDNCTIIGPVEIGADCSISQNVTLGTDGLFSKVILGKKIHIRHFGGVRIGNDCIVHASSNISKSVNHNERTTLADGVHLGIGVHIGHDCKIGAGTEISGRAMMAGRVVIGEQCMLGAGAIISNAIKVGKGARIRIGSVVIDDVEEGGDISGNFAADHSRRLRQHLATKRK
jgi:UDP-3-O-[3-hydroxymyristoyl] glucosamine N-acyltransferase